MLLLPDEFDVFNTLGGGFTMYCHSWESFTDMFELVETVDLLPKLNINIFLN